MNGSHTKVLVVQPSLPRYRRAFFDQLSNTIDLRLLASHLSIDDAASAIEHKPRYLVCISDIKIARVAAWQIGVIGQLVYWRPDVFVINGNPRYLSSIVALFIARILRIPVIWWGHGRSSTSKRLGSKIRHWLMRCSSHVLLYYREEIDNLPKGIQKMASGIGNSLDLLPIQRALAEIGSEDVAVNCRLHDIDTKEALVTIGRVNEKAQLSVVIHGLQLLIEGGRNTKLIVIGDGPCRASLQKLADSLGVANQIVWVGELFDESSIALWMRSASSFVYGGAVGLSLIHAFAYGLPAIISSDVKEHNPEALLFEHRVNGISFESGSSASIAEAIDAMLYGDFDIEASSEHARRLVYERLGIDKMAQRMLGAINAVSH